MPTRFGPSAVTKADQRLSKALAHPLRAECLTYKETLERGMAMERGMAIGARSEGRIAERRHRGKQRRMTCSLLAFESPPGSPRNHELGEVTEA